MGRKKMKHIKKYTNFSNEKYSIIKKGKKLYADDKPLKTMSLVELDDNIIYWRNIVNNFMFYEGYTMVWFIDDDKNVKTLLEDGGSQLLHFPLARAFDWSASPITDIWKKNTPLQKHIIGVLKAYTTEKLIYIDMMSVRTGYMKNGINNFMVQSLVKEFPSAVIKFSKPTEEGKEFIKKYYPNAMIEGVIERDDIITILMDLKYDRANELYTSKDKDKAMKTLKIDLSSIKDTGSERQWRENVNNLYKEYAKSLSDDEIKNI